MTNYNYTCTSKSGACIVGHINDTNKFNRDDLMNRIMHNICMFVSNEKLPWDPFNVELIVSVHKEPKHKISASELHP